LGDYYRSIELGLSIVHFATAHPGTEPFRNTMGQAQGKSVGAVVFGSDQGLVGRFNDVVSILRRAPSQPLSATPRIWAVGERVKARLEQADLPLAGLF
jgi:F-type H+-transporting ATPase subunit gamma